MANFDLNLSTRPFLPYRLKNLALASVLVVLVVISVWQVFGFLQYSSLVRDVRPEQRAARVEWETLGQHLDVLKAKLDRPESMAKLNEIGFFNRIIERRDLSWTELFANLENMVPENVHLMSLRPEVLANRRAALGIVARGRSMPDIKEFIERLEQSPAFEKVEVSQEQKGPTGELIVTLTSTYLPEREVR